MLVSDNGEEERKEDANRAAGGGAAGNPSDSAIICYLIATMTSEDAYLSPLFRSVKHRAAWRSEGSISHGFTRLSKISNDNKKSGLYNSFALQEGDREGCVLSANQGATGDGARPITWQRYAPLITIGATPSSHPEPWRQLFMWGRGEDRFILIIILESRYLVDMSTFNFQLIDRYAILNLKDLEIKSPRLEKMSGIKARAEASWAAGDNDWIWPGAGMATILSLFCE